MGRTLAIGDIHGNYLGFKQCLERSNFDYTEDTLISLGDVVDGHSQSYEVVEELIKIPNLIAIKGNHDDWFFDWIKTGINPSNWMQGQKATGLSYLEQIDPNKPFWDYQISPGGGKHFVCSLKPKNIPQSHKDFFANQKEYYLDSENRLFVHGGFNRHYPIEDQGDILWWDRDLWSQALTYESMGVGPLDKKPPFKMVGDFKEVFIGHTSTQFWKEDEPMVAANIINLDTGGGWFGKVTIMDVNTKEFWQSDKGQELYPDYKGRQ